MNIKIYKISIIFFILVTVLLASWSIDVISIINEKIKKKEDLLVIAPEKKFIKELPPKDNSFPNENSALWDAFNEKNNDENNQELEREDLEKKDVQNLPVKQKEDSTEEIAELTNKKNKNKQISVSTESS